MMGRAHRHQEEMGGLVPPPRFPSSVPVRLSFSGALTSSHMLCILLQVEWTKPGRDCVFHRELSPGCVGQEGNLDRKRSTWPSSLFFLCSRLGSGMGQAVGTLEPPSLCL